MGADKAEKKRKKELVEVEEEVEEVTEKKKSKKKKATEAEEEAAEEVMEKTRTKKKKAAEAKEEEEMEEVTAKKKKKKKAAEAEEEEVGEVPEKKKSKIKKAAEEDGQEEVEDAAEIIKAKKKKMSADADDEEEKETPISKKSAQPTKTEEADDGQHKIYQAFVGGLRSHVDEDKIWTDFAECGKVTDVLLARWPEDNSSKGIAFVTFETEAALKKCVEWNGTVYESAKIRVERKEGASKPKKDMGLGGQHGKKPAGCTTIAVLTLAKEATEDDLYAFFEKCGAVTGVKILKHRETHESRGIAFVDFEDTMHTDKAVNLTGKKICGQPVKIEWAAPKNDRSVKGKGEGKGDGKGKSSAPAEKPDGCVNCVVRNLSKNASEDDLWRFFMGCKSVNNVSIMKDKDTWTSKGIAFIDFDDTADTDKAVKQSGQEILGQAVRVDYKMPK